MEKKDITKDNFKVFPVFIEELELKEDYEDYFMHEDGGIFTTRVGKTTKELTKDCVTPYARMESIVHFVQDSIEIAEDNQTRSFPEILKDKLVTNF